MWWEMLKNYQDLRAGIWHCFYDIFGLNRFLPSLRQLGSDKGESDVHIVLAWDIKVKGDRWTTINNDLKTALTSYSWVRPLPALYIIKVDSAETRKAIVNNLVEIIKKYNETIHFVASPPMIGGSYDGWLPRDLWTKIGERVN